MMRRAVVGLACGAALFSARSAAAFCGFYVSEGGASLGNDATQVVLMRVDNRTVLSMQNDYKGPPDRFAMVVPVPVVLQQAQVKTLPRDVFARLEDQDAPRLVEYWEQDPCVDLDLHFKPGSGGGLGVIGAAATGASAGAAPRVVVEAQFTVGEYEIVILSSNDSLALDGWLRANKYAIPPGADAALKPYVTAGMKFFVAKVDPKKLTFQDGHAALSPLRFHYDTESFSLPVRLGLLNATGKQDLIVHVLAPQRYEASNFDNVTMPTNLDVDPKTKGSFAGFYASLFDHVSAEHPKALVTEYSWTATSCDPCPNATLTPQDLLTLGADVAGVKEYDMTATRVRAKGPDADFIKRRLDAVMVGSCMHGAATGALAIELDKGKPKTVTLSGPAAADAPGKACVESRVGRLRFDGTGHADVDVEFKEQRRPPPLTLTRLHLRYGKDDLRDDIVFKVAPGITGGREMMATEGQQGLERGARPTGNDQSFFQARYVIRHAWEGPIACASPRRGVWGGPWPSVNRA